MIRSSYSIKSSNGSRSSGTPRIVEFVEGLVSSVEWPAYIRSTDLQEVFMSLQVKSQRVIRALARESRNELLLDLCELYGYRVIGEREVANVACPIVAIDLPFSIVVHGALLNTQDFGHDIEETISRIASQALFVLVLDSRDSLKIARPSQVNVSVISDSYFENLVAGILALNYLWQVHHESFQRTLAFDQLELFLDTLGVSLETTEMTARKLGLG